MCNDSIVRENVFFSLFFIKYQIYEYWFNWRVNNGNGGKKKKFRNSILNFSFSIMYKS